MWLMKYNPFFLFYRVIKENIVLISRAFRNHFVIQDFPDFVKSVEDFYWKCKVNTGGKVCYLFLNLCKLISFLLFYFISWGMYYCYKHYLITNIEEADKMFYVWVLITSYKNKVFQNIVVEFTYNLFLSCYFVSCLFFIFSIFFFCWKSRSFVFSRDYWGGGGKYPLLTLVNKYGYQYFKTIFLNCSLFVLCLYVYFLLLTSLYLEIIINFL